MDYRDKQGKEPRLYYAQSAMSQETNEQSRKCQAWQVTSYSKGAKDMWPLYPGKHIWASHPTATQNNSKRQQPQLQWDRLFGVILKRLGLGASLGNASVLPVGVSR